LSGFNTKHLSTITIYQFTGKKINLELIANPDRLNGFLQPMLTETIIHMVQDTMRPIELLGKILIEGYHADIQTNSYGTILIVKPQQILSYLAGAMIRKAGFKFKGCYSEANGRTVLLFFKDIASSTG
jgi:hypothetical protein